MKKTILCFVLIASAAAAASAQETKKWKDAAELSYVQTSGNSKTSTLSAKNTYNYDWEKAALELTAGGQRKPVLGPPAWREFSRSSRLSAPNATWK